MRYNIVVTLTARQETLNAYIYYEGIRAGLGDDFLAELEYCYDRLRNNPLVYGYVDEKLAIRDMQIPRFPFVIIYRIAGETIVISAIYNTHRKPLF